MYKARPTLDFPGGLTLLLFSLLRSSHLERQVESRHASACVCPTEEKE